MPTHKDCRHKARPRYGYTALGPVLATLLFVKAGTLGSWLATGTRNLCKSIASRTAVVWGSRGTACITHIRDTSEATWDPSQDTLSELKTSRYHGMRGDIAICDVARMHSSPLSQLRGFL